MKKVIKFLFLIIVFISLGFTLHLKFSYANNDKWYRVWGGKGYDYSMGIAVDSSDNIYLGGITEIFGGNYIHRAMCLIKYDNTGNYQWNKTISGSSHIGGAITIDSFDNIFLAGEIYNPNSSNYDFILIKLDTSGNCQWNKTWDRGNDDICYTIGLDSIGNIYLAGSSYSGWNDEDFCLVKYDKFGNYLWNRTWGGDSNDQYTAIVFDSSDNLYLAGVTYSFGDENMCLVKYNSTGDIQWYKIWGGPKGGNSHAIVLDALDNIYVGGSYGADFFLVKFNTMGNFLWNRTWSRTSSDYCYCMLIDPSDNLYLAGTSGEQFSMVVYDTSGNFQWAKSISLYWPAFATGIIMDHLKNIYIGGFVYLTNKDHDIILIKNLQLFPTLQISGYNTLIFMITIVTFLLVIILKVKYLDDKKTNIRQN